MEKNYNILKKISLYFYLRWNCDGGYREFFKISIPLILSTGAWSIQHFVDRMFLTWYSPSAIAASMPAGMLNFSILSIFLGTVGYSNTFVAQYFGANKFNRIGPVIWQGIYISLIGGVIISLIAPFSKFIFQIIGHEISVQENEIIYFRFLCLGGFPFLASASLSGFFSGRGQTWIIMWVNIIGTVFNIIFDYFLIFGHWFFPVLGIKGAAISTVISAVSTTVIYAILISNKKYNDKYNTLKAWRINKPLLKRIIKFGFPNGIQFFTDIAGFTVFIMLLGTLGTASLAASNIAFNISTIAFMPMIGSGIAISVLVGQYLGKDNSKTAERCVYSGFHITFLYMASICTLYIAVPKLFVLPFAASVNNSVYFKEIESLIPVLLRYVAVYSLFDTMNIIFASAIKGAGDTNYIMRVIIAVSFFILIVPSYIGIVVLKYGIYFGWLIVTVYASSLGIAFFHRFLKGKWKTMRVIETAPFVPPIAPDASSEEYL